MFFYRLNIFILFFFFLISESFAESLFEKNNPFVFIKGGEFVFGNNDGEENEKPQFFKKYRKFLHK